MHLGSAALLKPVNRHDGPREDVRQHDEVIPSDTSIGMGVKLIAPIRKGTTTQPFNITNRRYSVHG